MSKRIYTGFFIGSALLGITGLNQFFHTSGQDKMFALSFGIGGTTAALTALGLGLAYGTDKEGQMKEFEKTLEAKIKEKEQAHKKELTSYNTQLESLKNTVDKYLVKDTQLNAKIEQQLSIITQREKRIADLEGITSNRDTRIEDFLVETRRHTKTFLLLRKQHLESLKKSLEKAIWDEIVPISTKQSNKKRVADIIGLLEDLSLSITEIETLEFKDYKSIINYAFEFDDKLINIRNRWKSSQVKGHRDESEQLRTQLSNSVSKDVALESFNASLAEYDEQLSAKYDKLLNQTDIYDQLINNLEERHLKINELLQTNDALEQEIIELKKPLLAVGTTDYALAANRIANYYYENYKYRLDVIHWVETETGYYILFATRRNPGLTESELLPKNTQEQLAAFTNCLVGTLPKFTFNYQHSTVTLDITLRKAVKKTSAKDEIDRLWIPASKFEQTVKGWSRIRVTGGSESGKSPTAENLAVCILSARPGVAKLCNPQHNSVKNYWTLPTIAATHAESEKQIAELAKKVDARAAGSESKDVFEFYVFDEIDSTMSHTKNKKSIIGGNVNFIIKQVSHQNLGAIFIGQNANVSEYPGMDRSDWNSAVNVHIGSNAYDAITNSNLFTTDEVTRLKGIADKLTNYCNSKNEELGLDRTEPTAYRFAFVVEPNKKPYFIELPSFGEYQYTDLQNASVQTQSAERRQTQTEEAEYAEANDSNPDSTVAEILAEAGYVGSSCPKCKNGSLKLSTPIRGVSYYICDNCQKKTSANSLKNI